MGVCLWTELTVLAVCTLLPPTSRQRCELFDRGFDSFATVTTHAVRGDGRGHDSFVQKCVGERVYKDGQAVLGLAFGPHSLCLFPLS